MLWDHLRNILTPQNALLSEANSQNLDSASVDGPTIPTTTRVKVSFFFRKKRFKNENEIEDHGTSSPKAIGVLTVLRCIFVANS